MSHTFTYTFANNGYGGALNATTKPAAEFDTDLTADPSSDNMQPRDI